MDVWRSLDEVPDDLGHTVLVVGNFDGVHRGHQAVVSRAASSRRPSTRSGSFEVLTAGRSPCCSTC